MGKYDSKTFYLFAKPSFIEGYARILDLGTTLEVYNVSNTETEADKTALRNDWLMVGKDIKEAITQYERAG